MDLAEKALRELRPELIAIVRAARTLEIRSSRISGQELIALAEDIGRRAELARMRLDEAITSEKGQQTARVPALVSLAVQEALADLEPLQLERNIRVDMDLADDLAVLMPVGALVDVIRTLFLEILGTIPPDSDVVVNAYELSGIVVIAFHLHGDEMLAERLRPLCGSPAEEEIRLGEIPEKSLTTQVLRALVRILDGMIAGTLENETFTITLLFHQVARTGRRVIDLDGQRLKQRGS